MSGTNEITLPAWPETTLMSPTKKPQIENLRLEMMRELYQNESVTMKKLTACEAPVVRPLYLSLDASRPNTPGLLGAGVPCLVYSSNVGDQDQVLVSIRIRPTYSTCAWTFPNHQNIHLAPGSVTPRHTTSTKFSQARLTSPSTPPSRRHGGLQRAYLRVLADRLGRGSLSAILTSPASFRARCATPDRECLLRCSYLEICNEAVHDLGDEVVTRLAGVRATLTREGGNRRKSNTHWIKRSSRSHSVFRMAMESRERGLEARMSAASPLPERAYHPEYEWALDDTELEQPVDPGSRRQQARDGRREHAESDRSCRFGARDVVQGPDARASASTRGKTDHAPFRIYKLLSLLRPSLSGPGITESTSTLLFAQRIKRAALKTEKKEVVDTDAILQGDAQRGAATKMAG
ncbi:hypothetical protein FIBSPDRAFT_960352 [Athelia psychrophila]|uniref:Kinesin motor domain-containing protein n=1 Tax=Athelia psychrophila TaxID=1759441 RepID=A0A166CHM7_9AGAM|nr:hypothetical protein FIBSPDRAFT_960352 [Fibularhizoctonia sp. CBS 109695]